jgi:hypothetical protein
MSPTLPAAATEQHTRLLKCALEAEDARAYWQRVTPGEPVPAQRAFEDYWFGARSLDRVAVLLANFRARFDAFPQAIDVLRRWRDMDPGTRALICHWHVMLTDPLYRDFAGDLLVERRLAGPGTITRDVVIAWVADHGAARWTTATRVQFASKLLSTALSAGLVGSSRDPRPLVWPSVSDDALTYLLHLLRGVEFQGALLDNLYLRSVGLDPLALPDRLRGLPAVTYRRQADLTELAWHHPDLGAWFDATHDREGAA